MECPECNGKTKTIESRKRWKTVIRRRECLSCHNRFTTIEKFYDDKERQNVREMDGSDEPIKTNVTPIPQPEVKPLSYMDKLFMDAMGGYKQAQT